MTHRIAPLLLALGLGATSSLVLAADAPAAPATPATPAANAGPAMMGPMAGQRGKGAMAGRKMMREKPESFTEESVRKMADGRVFKRSVEQKVGEGTFMHKEVMTNPEGKTASRTLTATLNKEGTTWTRRIDAVEFDGSTWSRSQDVPAQHGPQGDDEAAAPAKRPGKDAGKPAKKAN